jgi:lipopolysaccharide/colanic/teichoic acid biosynthesis glycosyltransferase
MAFSFERIDTCCTTHESTSILNVHRDLTPTDADMLNTRRAAVSSDAYSSSERSGSRPFRASPYFRWHGAINRVCAALLLIPAAPLIGLCVVLVRATSPGPGIYQQLRVGRHGRTFMLYKIRSMRQDAEAGSGAVWTTSLRDPRITRLGQFLRLTHLDEFPQLWNVLRGEMALIGPRPERPEFTQTLALEVPGYLDRLAVLPGVTGLAQLQLPPDSDIDSVRRKVAVDREYIRRGSLGLDARIFVCTLLRLVGLNGSWARRVLALRGAETPIASHPQTIAPVQASVLAVTMRDQALIDTQVMPVSNSLVVPQGMKANPSNSSSNQRPAIHEQDAERKTLPRTKPNAQIVDLSWLSRHPNRPAKRAPGALETDDPAARDASGAPSEEESESALSPPWGQDFVSRPEDSGVGIG